MNLGVSLERNFSAHHSRGLSSHQSLGVYDIIRFLERMLAACITREMRILHNLHASSAGVCVKFNKRRRNVGRSRADAIHDVEFDGCAFIRDES